MYDLGVIKEKLDEYCSKFRISKVEFFKRHGISKSSFYSGVEGALSKATEVIDDGVDPSIEETDNTGSLIEYLDKNKSEKLDWRNTLNHFEKHQDLSIIGAIPILVCDVWEHAYYLNYQNKRAEYIDSFFKIINWEVIGDRYLENLK